MGRRVVRDSSDCLEGKELLPQGLVGSEKHEILVGPGGERQETVSGDLTLGTVDTCVGCTGAEPRGPASCCTGVADSQGTGLPAERGPQGIFRVGRKEGNVGQGKVHLVAQNDGEEEEEEEEELQGNMSRCETRGIQGNGEKRRECECGGEGSFLDVTRDHDGNIRERDCQGNACKKVALVDLVVPEKDHLLCDGQQSPHLNSDGQRDQLKDTETQNRHQELLWDEGKNCQDLYRGADEMDDETSQGAEGDICTEMSFKGRSLDQVQSEKELEATYGVNWSGEFNGRADRGTSIQGLMFFKEDFQEKAHRGKILAVSERNCGKCSGDEERSPGNGSSGSADGTDIEISISCTSGCRERGLGSNRWNESWQGEMEEVKNFAEGPPCVLQHNQEAKADAQSTWCWCLQLYLGEMGGSDPSDGETLVEMKSPGSGYSLNSTLRFGENSSERNGEVNGGEITEAHVLSKKGGKGRDTPELQEWVSWWQGWSGSCRKGSGRRKGKGAPVLGCRGEARGSGQKQQDVWVLREWARKDGGRHAGGQGVPGGEVWVLREDERGKQNPVWPLKEQDVWVPREPRKKGEQLNENSKWPSWRAKSGSLDKSMANLLN
ncbi:hypothetical protein XELAEV_18024228mg [Xenopus laevis]|uniref:Uncharacterized protein n=1 Tax=Xenopus laevis TaxID=8355 RepID=A0A974CZV2_XENLA|nr:hypothetical protein XELAEV_18024228mg [Xenopus laevis]